MTKPVTLGHLVRKRGKATYDYEYDVLYFMTKGRNYKKSVQFQNFVADIDEEGYVTGVRVFDASKVFGIDKIALKNMTSCEFSSNVENKVITIMLKFTCKIRNRLLVFPVQENFTLHLAQTTTIVMTDSLVGPVTA